MPTRAAGNSKLRQNRTSPPVHPVTGLPPGPYGTPKPVVPPHPPGGSYGPSELQESFPLTPETSHLAQLQHQYRMNRSPNVQPPELNEAIGFMHSRYPQAQRTPVVVNSPDVPKGALAGHFTDGTIQTRPNFPPNEAQISLGHELGHQLQHRPVPAKSINGRNWTNDPYETGAENTGVAMLDARNRYQQLSQALPLPAQPELPQGLQTPQRRSLYPPLGHQAPKAPAPRPYPLSLLMSSEPEEDDEAWFDKYMP